MGNHNPIPEGQGPVIGPGDPGEIGAGREWVNSITGERKTRNPTDNGWLPVPTPVIQTESVTLTNDDILALGFTTDLLPALGVGKDYDVLHVIIQTDFRRGAYTNIDPDSNLTISGCVVSLDYIADSASLGLTQMSVFLSASSVNWLLRPRITFNSDLATTYGSRTRFSSRGENRPLQLEFINAAGPLGGGHPSNYAEFNIVYREHNVAPADRTASSITIPATLEIFTEQQLTLADTGPVYALNAAGRRFPYVGAWASDNEAVATVDANGVVTGVAVGTANITATTASPAVTSNVCAVTVPS